MIVLGIVAVVLIALFVISVAYRPGSGVSSDRRESWRERLLRAQPVAPGQLGGCTAALGAFTITGTCELRIAAADVRSRRLVVEATDALAIVRTMDADGRRMNMRAKLEPGKREQLFIGKAGETIGLVCLGGLTCRASVQ